jgi:hypothetical protein
MEINMPPIMPLKKKSPVNITFTGLSAENEEKGILKIAKYKSKNY